jgi:phosphatidylserine/phosphatidylglycerophosphate/cardiolipin synthase-like enzyme
MFGLRKLQRSDELAASRLLDQGSFYQALVSDLIQARREVIIESPFLSYKRLDHLLPILHKLAKRNVRVIINTKHPTEQDTDYRQQAELCIVRLQEAGADVLFTGGHHRKLAIIDRKILYEGSLNILSQNDSCEVMRRICSKQLANQMIEFIGINRFIN